MKIGKCYLLSAFILICICSKVNANQIRGLVLEENGTPVTGVIVSTKIEQVSKINTDAEGGFLLSQHGKVLFFNHPKFLPKSIILSDPHEDLLVIKLLRNKSELESSACSYSGNAKNVFGERFLLKHNDTVNVKKVKDIDYKLYRVKSKLGKGELWIWEGLSTNPSFIPEDLILQSSEYIENRWGCIKKNDEYWLTGVDLKGKLKTGGYWHWRSLGVGFIIYSVENATVASHFENIINTLCCISDKPPVR